MFTLLDSERKAGPKSLIPIQIPLMEMPQFVVKVTENSIGLFRWSKKDDLYTVREKIVQYFNSIAIQIHSLERASISKFSIPVAVN